ncbi:hypothetical protein ZWY2020_029083 [Hordeum vulgare]|nr:hypothetical protein ZWY2020_029083 [Hordeum vulgare]
MAPAADHAADLLRKLSLDPKGVVAGQAKEAQNKAERRGGISKSPGVVGGQWFAMGQQDYKNANMYGAGADAYQYYYGGWGDYSVYVGFDGAESLNPGVYGDMYCYPQYGVASSGYDGQQMYGSQHYQHRPTYHQPQTTSTTKPAYKLNAGKSDPYLRRMLAAPAAYQQPGLLVASKANSNSTDSSTGLKKTIPNHGDKAAYPSYGGHTQQKLSVGNSTSTDSNPKTKGLLGQNLAMGPQTPGYMSSMYSSVMYNANAYGPDYWYGSHLYGSGMYGGWNVPQMESTSPEEIPMDHNCFGNENIDGLNELKRGLRSTVIKNEQGAGEAAVAPAKGQELPTGDASNAVVQDQYNKADFVNTSGQFIGLAEMVGQVDFNKTVEYWQQDKWTGCFPVKWHIVKDIPNTLLKHIILEYNKNKRVTNSRDTQEVRLEQGLQVLKIFKDHVCKTSMLDDFGFYDNREKIMQEKKSKRQQQPLEKIMSKKPLSINNTENQDVDEKQGIMNKKPLSTSNTENQDADAKQGLQELKVLGEKNPVVENGVAAGAVNGVAPTDASPTAAAVGC